MAADADRAVSNWLDDLARSTSPNAVKRVSTKAGLAAKRAGQKRVTAVMGADAAMSNFRPRGRPVKLGMGFDVRGDGVDMNLRPKGVWVLANSGRKRAGFISPRTGEAMPVAPGDFRAYSAFYPSRGTGVKRDTQDAFEKVVPKAAFQAFQDEIRKALR